MSAARRFSAVSLGLLAAFPLFGPGPRAAASDAKIEEATQAVDLSKLVKETGLDSIFESLTNPNQFYYLPSTIRFWKDKQGEPMWSVIKYNLAYAGDQIYDEKGRMAVDPDGKVLQGGVFQATFDLGLPAGALEKIRTKVLKPGQKIGRMPLDNASLYIEYIDPEDAKKSVKLGPIPAPLTDDCISVTIPLTRSALDILKPIAENPKGTSAAPFTAYLAFTYNGYDNAYSVDVTGSASAITETQHIKTGVEGQYWFFKASADYENFKQSLIQKNAIKVVVLGDAGKDKQKVDDITSKVIDKVLANFMDAATLEPNPGLDAGKGDAKMEPVNVNEGKKDAEGNPKPARNAGVGFSFSMKQSKKSVSKDFAFSWSGRSKITKLDSRYGKLDFEYPEKSKGRHYIEATASDWSVARPAIAIAPSVAPWFTITSVECAYAGKQFQATLLDPADPTKGRIATLADWTTASNQGGSFKFGPVNIPPLTTTTKDAGGKATVSVVSNIAAINRNTTFTVGYSVANPASAADKARLDAAGVTGLDPKDVKTSFDATRLVFNGLYGNKQTLVLDASKINGQAALINEVSLPPLPRRASFMFRVVDSTKAIDWTKNPAVIPRLQQAVSPWVRKLVAVKPEGKDAGPGDVKYAERYVVDTSRPARPLSYALDNLKPTEDGFFKATDDLFVFLNPDGSETRFDFEFTVNVGTKVVKRLEKGKLPGDLIVLDIGEILSKAP